MIMGLLCYGMNLQQMRRRKALLTHEILLVTGPVVDTHLVAI
jgi:hypothetical protein